jgi:hypothetical protein
MSQKNSHPTDIQNRIGSFSLLSSMPLYPASPLLIEYMIRNRKQLSPEYQKISQIKDGLFIIIHP